VDGRVQDYAADDRMQEYRFSLQNVAPEALRECLRERRTPHRRANT
jgi:hypothetical protein